MVIDPLLRAFEALRLPGDVEAPVTCVCADDIGDSMFLVLSMLKFAQVFEIFRAASALTMKAPKSIMVSTGAAYTLHIRDLIKDFLA